MRFSFPLPSIQSLRLFAVLASMVVVLPSDQLAAQSLQEEVPPLRLSDASGIICELESREAGGAAGGRSSLGWLQSNNLEAALSPQRNATFRTARFNSAQPTEPDANRDGHLSRDELQTLDHERRFQLLRQYDADADGQLSRYEMPQRQTQLEEETLQPDSPTPQPNPPSAQQAFENLRRYRMPSSRQPTARRNPYARAATFGAPVGALGPRAGAMQQRYVGGYESNCRPSRSSVFLAAYRY